MLNSAVSSYWGQELLPPASSALSPCALLPPHFQRGLAQCSLRYGSPRWARRLLADTVATRTREHSGNDIGISVLPFLPLNLSLWSSLIIVPIFSNIQGLEKMCVRKPTVSAHTRPSIVSIGRILHSFSDFPSPSVPQPFLWVAGGLRGLIWGLNHSSNIS